MNVTIKIPDQLAADARARGVPIEQYVQEILAREAVEAAEIRIESVRSAIDRILVLRKGNKLEGLQTKNLAHEGHKY